MFKLRQCSDSFFANRTAPCLQYQIKRCTAPCVQFVSKKNYQEQVEQCALFLQGKNVTVIEQCAQKMQQASQQQQYEQAAHYRDQMRRLRSLQSTQSMVKDGGNIDVLACATDERQAAICVLFVRAGQMLGHKTFYFNLSLGLTGFKIRRNACL